MGHKYELREVQNELTFIVLPILYFVSLTLVRLRWVEEVQLSRITLGSSL